MGCEGKLSNRCSDPTNAVCTAYEGILSKNTKLDKNACQNVEVVIEDINQQLDSLDSEIDLSSLTNTCIDYHPVTPGDIKVKEAILGLHAKMLAVMTKIGMGCDNCPTCANACPEFLTEDISCANLDFGTLVDACGHKPTTLEATLQLILDKLNTP